MLEAAAKFAGAYTTLMTPFESNGDLDEQALKRLVEFQITHGATKLSTSGVTGETASLTDDEKLRVLEVVINAAAGRTMVIPDIGTECLKRTVSLAKRAQSLGANAVLAFVPYLDPPTPDGMVAYFESLAEEVSIPVLIHNLPARTTVDMQPEIVARLAAHRNIVGIKEGNQDVVRLRQLISLVQDADFVVLHGNDSLALLSMMLGGHGHVSVAANVLPAECIAITESALRGDWEMARKLYMQCSAFFRVIYIATNPIALKCAFNMLHFNVGEPRIPLTPLGDHQQMKLKQVLASCGLFSSMPTAKRVGAVGGTQNWAPGQSASLS